MSTIKSIKPKIIVICGQTGSGKTSLAVSLCKRFNGEIVNADSRQVYKEMDIGTAKDLDQIFNFQFSIFNQCSMKQFSIGGIPVHLVNIVEPNERYNVGRFKKEAEEAIADIISRGKVPFVVGGTGLYIDSLVDNFQFSICPQEGPANYHKINVWDNFQSISNDQCSIGEKNFVFCRGAVLAPEKLEDLVKLLKKVDPEALRTVDLKNKRRVERALEYCLTTGKKFSESRKKGERKYEVLKIAPLIDRETLHKKIDQRVEEMIEEGLENEVKMLAEKYGWESEAMTGIGYREWRVRHSISNFQFPISNKIPNDKSQMSKNNKPSIQHVADQIKLSTRQYAKRQMTWFKRDKEINWVEDKNQVGKLVEDFIF